MELLGCKNLKCPNGSGDNRFVWDAWISGPQVGVAFKF